MLDRKPSILITVDPEIPVPPLYYGGIERIVDMLIRGLIDAGCEVYLFANHESRVAATVIPYRGGRSSSIADTLRNALQIKNYIREIKNIDIIHSFGRLAYITFMMKSTIPKIQSYQRHITPRSILLAKWLGGNNITFTACSKFCAGTASFMGGEWQVIPNGVNLEKYNFTPSVSADAPLVFLGRIERIKGAHTAIGIAKKTKRRLLIAGNHAKTGRDYEYFKNEILPHCDQRSIEYIGEVDDTQKSELLASASALLFPVEWDEPFGIVMVEALACGTPVIASSRGSVPEVIKHKVTGFICNSPDEMTEAVGMIPRIERIECRKDAEARFSDKVITQAYLRLYRSCIQKKPGIA
jgi:glycosyltransferase involved in cell wall biosynthesis